ATLRDAVITAVDAAIADEQKVRRAEHDELLAELQARTADIVAPKAAPGSDAATAKVAKELEALRRGLGTSRANAAIQLNEATMNELVTRVADELEIRIAAVQASQQARGKRK